MYRLPSNTDTVGMNIIAEIVELTIFLGGTAAFVGGLLYAILGPDEYGRHSWEPAWRPDGDGHGYRV